MTLKVPVSRRDCLCLGRILGQTSTIHCACQTYTTSRAVACDSEPSVRFEFFHFTFAYPRAGGRIYLVKIPLYEVFRIDSRLPLRRRTLLSFRSVREHDPFLGLCRNDVVSYLDTSSVQARCQYLVFLPPSHTCHVPLTRPKLCLWTPERFL